MNNRKQLFLNLFFILVFLFSFSCQKNKLEISVPQNYEVSIYAGNIPRSDGLVFDKQGNLYASCEESKRFAKILKINPQRKISTFVKKLNRADGIVYNNFSDYFLVSEEATDGRILKIKSNGKIETLISEKDIENPEGMIFDKLGNLFIAEDEPNGRIVKFSNNKLTVLAEGLNRSEGITIDRNGNLFVAETETNRILKINQQGEISVFINEIFLKNPDNIIYNSRNNNFFVTEDTNPGRVLKISAKGKVSVFASGLVYPQGMAFDSKSNLFVSEQGLDRIIKFTRID